MKRVLTLMLCAVMLLSTAACSAVRGSYDAIFEYVFDGSGENAGDGEYVSEAPPEYDPDKYTIVKMDAGDLAVGDLTLVNNAVQYPFPEKTDLVSIFDFKTDTYFVRDKNVLLERRVMQPLNDLLDAFQAASGLKTVNVVAGYRTTEDQEKLYNDSLAANGAAHTEKYVAQPGGSEHHTGLAVDFSIFFVDTGTSDSFDGSGAYAWILENAWRYGFVQRYQAGKEACTGIYDEPWHFRYVGQPHAYLMQEKDLCLEEYVEYLRGYRFGTQTLQVNCEGLDYEIWYCEGTDVYVPREGLYNISGDNQGGFFVTAQAA